jgi:hypothetical protein
MRNTLALAVFLMSSAAVRAEEAISKEQIQKDLRLNVRLLGARKVEPGVPIGVSMELVNDSKSRTYPVVKTGDGSDFGKRNPHVFFTATITGPDGKDQPVAKARYVRCKLYDVDWKKDVVELGPGRTIDLNPWVPAPSTLLEFQQPGHVRLAVHYACAAIREGVPAFEIVSAPVEFDVVRPLDLVVTVRRPMRSETITGLADLLAVTLVNQSEVPMHVTAPTLAGNARVDFEIDGEFAGWRPNVSKARDSNAVNATLKPGEKASLLGKGELANGIDGTWEYPTEGVVRLRAVYRRSTWKNRSVILSDWVEVKVEK